MKKRNYPKVVTANHLLEGDAVWLTETGGWSRSVEEAVVLHDAKEAEDRLKAALAQPHVVVGPYLADVDPEADGLPVHFRETFRTRGPSNYAHGKQAGD